MNFPNESRQRVFSALVGLIGLIVLVSVYLIITNIPSPIAAYLTVLNRLFDLGFAAFVVCIALMLGRICLRRMGFFIAPGIEQNVFALVVGLGVIVEVLIGLGFLRLLYTPWLIGILLLLAWIASGEVRIALDEWNAIWHTHIPFSKIEKFLLGGMIITALPVGLRALTPPTAYDALMYHLPAPKAFLDAHALLPFLENIQANSPIAFDLLTMFGLSVGSDVFPQLLQFALGIALALGVYQFAACAFNRSVAILAAAILFSIPIFGILAGWAYLDVSWVLCEFLSVYAFWRWDRHRRTQWLVLCAGLMGLALSNKYLALQGMIILGITIVVSSHSDGWLHVARNLIVFGFVAALVAFPWYWKNWLWLGNPVYPYFWGGVNYDALRLEFNTYLLSGYGIGRDWLAYVMLPLNIFARSGEFGPVAPSAPSFVFLLLPAYLALPKTSTSNLLLALSAARFVIWAVGAQELRFLLVIYPMLSIVSGYVIDQLLRRWDKPLLRVEIGVLIGLIIGAGVWFQWRYCLQQSHLLAYLTGVASRADFLRANLNPYVATEFVNATLPSTARILAISDGRGYYFEREFIPDTGRDHWRTRIIRGETLDLVLQNLQAEGITHLWVSTEDLIHVFDWIDRAGRVRAEMRTFDDFQARYLHLLYHDARGFRVYALPR